MKFFHLADLHIGKIVNGFSMIDDQNHIFRQILEYIKKERPDAVLIAGDIYDKSIPGTAPVRIFDDFLTGLVNEKVAVIYISGNHDSPERLEFGGRILQNSNVNIYCVFDGSIHKVTFSDEYGEIDIDMLPFIRPSSVREFYREEGIDSYESAVRRVLENFRVNPLKRNILVTHQFIVSPGYGLERSDSEIEPVGSINNISAGIFSDYDYVALGHLHGCQKVGNEYIRYCGSPLKYSFSECFQKKSITVVEMKEKGNIQIKLLPLLPLRDMRRIKGPIDHLMSKEIALAGDTDDYLHVTLTDEGDIVDALGKLRSVYPNIMELIFDNTKSRSQISLNGEIVIENKTPFELFEDFYLEQNGLKINSSQQKILQKLFEKGGENI